MESLQQIEGVIPFNPIEYDSEHEETWMKDSMIQLLSLSWLVRRIRPAEEEDQPEGEAAKIHNKVFSGRRATMTKPQFKKIRLNIENIIRVCLTAEEEDEEDDDQNEGDAAKSHHKIFSRRRSPITKPGEASI